MLTYFSNLFQTFSSSSRPVSNSIPIRRTSDTPSSTGTTPSSVPSSSVKNNAETSHSYSKSPTKPMPSRGSFVGSSLIQQPGKLPRNGSAPQFNQGIEKSHSA